RLVGGLLNMYSEKLRAQEIKEDPTYWKAQNYKLAAAKFERDLAADAAKAAGAVGSVGTPYTAGDKEKEYDFAKLVKKDEAFLTGVESQAEEFIKKFTESNPDLAASIIKKSNNEDERGGRSKATFLME